MQLRNPVLACFVIAATALSAPAQGRTIPAGDPQPILQIEAGGPTAFVTSLTFSPDGKRLYAAGFDKVVRVWNLNENTGRFELDPASYRIPIGPGIAGTINAIALSPDERWLAVGGQGIVRGSAGFRLPGLYLPKTGAYTEEMWLDEGTIYVFDTRTRLVRPLRGHLGPIWSLAFAPAFDGKPPLLVSTGRDRDMETASYKGSVRLWDVVQGELVAERTDMPNGTGTRPGLAAWHTGKELKQVRVGIAWEDGLLRVWDVASNRLMIAKDGWNGKRDGGYNNTAIWLPDARRLLTLSLRYPIDGQPAAMQIRQWSDDTNGPRETEVRSVTPTGVSAAMVPRALAPVSSQANGQIDQAAVVLLWKEQKDNTTVEDYYLYLRDLARDNFGGYLAYTRISVAGHLPALATSPKGKFIAVTGEHGRSIRLYSIQDLLRRKDKAQPQILRSIGQTFRFAAFVKKGQERGLVLSEQPSLTAGGTPRAPARGDIIFSFDKRRFSQELDGWEIDTPPTGGWKLAYKRPEQGAAAELHVSRQGKTTVIKLHPREVVSDVDILPAMPPLNVPVVAVAAHDLGQPLLRLYDANTGTIIRYFTGHLNRIHSVAFSGDGQLLVTTADDQTVCVWSMAKLTKYLGRVGTLPGVAVKNLLAIDNVRGGAPVKGKLQPADIIDAVVYKGATKKYFSKIRLYDDLAALAPTTPVTLRIRDDQARATRQVEVRVNQGIVDRTACLLLRLGQPNPLTAISLTQASRGFSPLAGLNLKYVAAVVAAPGDQLAEGDLVETITIPGAKPKRVASARDFYITIALTRPGTRVTLGLRGKGKVVLEVKQGTDERKPLFSLFAAKAKKAGEWDWVGWNPIGPYEASGRRAEKLIGWHFNTGNPEKPAVFALADQYRKEYYREGILKDLVEQTELAQALDAWFRRDRLRELPEPRLTFWLDEVGPDPSKRNAQGQCIARATPLTIKLAIDNFPLDRIKAVHWQLGNGPARGFDSGRGRERTAVLNLPRGVYRLHAIVETSEDPPRTYSKDLVLKVLPPAPVAVSSQPRFAVTKDAEFRLEAIVTQKRAEEVRIHLVHRHRGQKVTDKMLALKADATTVRVSEPFKLLPGENVFELIAVNAKAPAEDRELESATLSWAMTYLPPKLKAAPPRIIIERIQPDPESPNSRPIAVQPGKTSRVHDSPIRLFGRIEGSDVLESAEWILGQKARTLAGFVGNQAKTFAFSQEVALQPGTQTIVLRAKSSRSEAVERSIAIEYQPRLPRVIVTAPPDDSVFFDEGTGLPAIEISGHIRRLNPYAAKAELLINGEPTPLDLPEEGDTWSKQIKLPKTGVNRLQVRLSNEWGMASVTEEIDVYVLQPPYQIRFDPVPPPKTPLIQLTARVRSPKPLIPETVQAEIDGRPIASVALERSPKDKDLWLIKLFDVPLEANKKNRVRLWVSNLDSRCRTPGEISIPFTPPAKPPAKAEVEFVTPTKDTVVTDPDLTVQFRVKSDSPLTRVELRQTAGREELRETFPVRNLAADADGYYRFQKRIRLLPRENRLYASAVNKGGETRTALVVSYLYTPVQLIVDRLEPAGPVGKPIQPTVLPDQRIAFKKPAEIARLRLRGRVRWSKDDDQEMTKVKLIRVYVNGFQQIPAVLEPPKGAERERVFVADLILNRPVDNRIEIELPDLKSDANNRREFTLDCLKPESGQRLHLLIVGVGEKDESKLTNQALLALRAQREKDTIRTPAFSEVRIYGPLTDFVTPQQVYAQLCLIKKTIDVLAGKGSPNDVVMVYYQGGEALKQNGNVFETSLSQYDKQLKRTGITFEGLQGFFDETLGAKLLWLDVAPVEVDETGKDQVADLPPEANINILRYRWISRQLARRGGINLLADWQQAMIRDNVGFLGSVTRQIADLYQKDYLNYQSFVPESLSKLLVNRKTK